MSSSTSLPQPATPMFLFNEGLDSAHYTESTGVNHNSPNKWLKAELSRQLDYLSYLLDIVNDQSQLSLNIVHTDSIIDSAVTTEKLADSSVTRNKIANLAVGNSQVADASLTLSKMAPEVVTAMQDTTITIDGGTY